MGRYLREGPYPVLRSDSVLIRPPLGGQRFKLWSSAKAWQIRQGKIVPGPTGPDLWTLLRRTTTQQIEFFGVLQALENPDVRAMVGRVAAGQGDAVARIWLFEDLVLDVCDPLDKQLLRLTATLLLAPT